MYYCFSAQYLVVLSHRTELLLQLSAVLDNDAVNVAQDNDELLTCCKALMSFFKTVVSFGWELSLLEGFEQMPEWDETDYVTDLASFFGSSCRYYRKA